MRTVINISLPKEMALEVERGVKKGNFSTKSEFFRSLLRDWMEEKLLEELKESQKEFEQGKAKLLRSLKDLR